MNKSLKLYKAYCGLRSDTSVVCVFVGNQFEISEAFGEETNRPPLHITELQRTEHHETVSGDNRAFASPVMARAREAAPRALPLYKEVLAYSDVFDWGNVGLGSLQLSIAILTDFLGKARLPEIKDKHREFCRIVIAGLPDKKWLLSERQMRFCLNVNLY